MATLYPPPAYLRPLWAIVATPNGCWQPMNSFLPARICLQTNHNIAKTQSSIELGTYSQPLPILSHLSTFLCRRTAAAERGCHFCHCFQSAVAVCIFSSCSRYSTQQRLVILLGVQITSDLESLLCSLSPPDNIIVMSTEEQ
jgi:hypothetical protein